MARRTRDLVRSVLLTVTALAGVARADQPDPAGTWLGSWTLPGHETHDLHVTIVPVVDGGWAGTVASLAGDIAPQPLQSLQVRGGTLTFSPLIGAATCDFRGTLSDDGNAIAGIVRAPALEHPGVFHLDRRLNVSEVDDVVTYGGDIPIPGRDYLPITIHMHPQPDVTDAAVDLPSIGLVGYPVRARIDGSVRFLNLPTAVDGTDMSIGFSPGGPQVAGLYTSGGQALPITLHRDRDRPVRRPQVPDRAGPWVDTPVVQDREGQPAHAAFMHPTGPGPWPAMLLLGDASTDVNGTQGGHPSMFLLATEAARRGIATLRTAAGETAGLRDRQRDTRLWHEYLLERPDIDSTRIAILGMGEGGLAAARLAPTRDGDLGMLVLIGAPVLPGIDIETQRLRSLLAQADPDPDLLEQAVQSRHDLIELALDDMNTQAQNLMARRWLTAQAEIVGSNAHPADARVQQAVASLQDPDVRYCMAFDPRTTLARMRDTPLLALHGERDAEYDAASNLEAIEQAVANRGGSVEVHRLEGLNHLLQPAHGRAATDYANIRMTMSPEAIDLIFDRVDAEFKARQAGEAP